MSFIPMMETFEHDSIRMIQTDFNLTAIVFGRRIRLDKEDQWPSVQRNWQKCSLHFDTLCLACRLLWQGTPFCSFLLVKTLVLPGAPFVLDQGKVKRSILTGRFYWSKRWSKRQPRSSEEVLMVLKDGITFGGLPSGKRLHNYGKSPFTIGRSTINGPISSNFHSFLYVYQRVHLTRKVRKAKANDFGDGFRAIAGNPGIHWHLSVQPWFKFSSWRKLPSRKTYWLPLFPVFC
jgi:hypothetical protein